MMRLPPARYLAPRTMTEATRMLAESAPDAALMAGGTDLLPNMKRLQVKPPTLIGLRTVRELRQVRRTDAGGLSLGAGATLTHLQENPLVRELCPPLADAIPLISTPLLRNMGTLGGNLCLDTRCHFINQSAFWRQAVGSCLKDTGDVCRVAPGSSRCWAITSADLPPLLIALDAQVRLVSANSERVIPLAELYRDDGLDYLTKTHEEILTEVILPPLDGTRAGYEKLRRRGTFDYPVLGVGAALRFNSDGSCASARIVLGAITSKPLEMGQATTLVGEKLSHEAIAATANAIALQARPLQLADFTNSYRQQMVALYVGRLLEQLSN